MNEKLIAKYDKVKVLIKNGMSVAKACKEAKMGLATYYAAQKYLGKKPAIYASPVKAPGPEFPHLDKLLKDEREKVITITIPRSKLQRLIDVLCE